MELFTMDSPLTAIIQLPLLLYFYTYVLDLHWSKKNLISIVLFLFLPTIVLYFFFGPLGISYYLAILLLFIYRKTKDFGHAIHVFIAFFILVIGDNISNIITFYLFNGITNELIMFISYFTIYITFIKLFAYCYKKIMEHLIKRWVFNSYVAYILLFLSIVTLIFMYINIMAIDHDNFYESVQNNLAMFLIYFVLLMISIFVILYLAFKQYKMKQREQEMKNFESYVTSIEQINQSMRKFKHDYINILSSLRTFIDNKNYEGLHTYFYDHILEANHHEQLNQQAMMMLNNLKINSLKGLVTTKILQAQSHQVPFYIEIVEEITDISIDPIILNRMVGILLDNAIEAARGVENGEVRMAFIHMDEVILLVVNNTFDKQIAIKVHEIYQEGFSTKGENRGLGLANLRQMINNLHNVNLNTKINSPYFIQEVEFQKE